MTTPILPNTFTGAVPEGFTLPWNTTRTMADVWAGKPQRPRPEPKPRATPESHVAKVRAAGTRDDTFYLRDWSGSYLRVSCDGMTSNRDFAWKGTDRQIERVRQKFANTAHLIASVAA